MSVNRFVQAARGAAGVCCGVFLVVLSAGCGGGGSSTPSGPSNVALSLSVVSNGPPSGLPPSVLNSVVQDQSGQASSFDVIVEGGLSNGTNFELQFNIVHDTGNGHNAIAPAGVTLPAPAAADGAYVDPSQNLDATPLYYDSFNRVCVKIQNGSQPYETLDSRIGASPVWVASASPITGGYAYGLHTLPRPLRAGSHDVVLYFYGVTVANQASTNSSGPSGPTAGLVFGTNIATGTGGIDLTAPGSFVPSYGQAYSVSFTVPAPAGFGVVKALRIRAQDAPDANGNSQSVSQIVYPPFSTSGSAVTGLSLNVISRGNPFTYSVDAYLDAAATESYAKDSGAIALPSSGSSASVTASLKTSIGPGYYDQSGMLHSFVAPKPLTLLYQGPGTAPAPLFVTVSSVDSQGLQYAYTISPGSPESALLSYPAPNNQDVAFAEPTPGMYLATSQSAKGIQTLAGTAPNGAGVGLTLIGGSTYMDPTPGSSTPSVLPQASIQAITQASTATVNVAVTNIPANAALLHVVLTETSSGSTEEFVADMPLASPPPSSVNVSVPVLALSAPVYTESVVAYSGMDAASNPQGWEVASGTGAGGTVALVPSQGSVGITANVLRSHNGGRK